MAWRNSVPEFPVEPALAAVSPVTVSDTAATRAPAAPRSLVFSFSTISPPRLMAKPLAGFAGRDAATRPRTYHTAPVQGECMPPPCSLHAASMPRSEEHTSELQSPVHLVC